VKHKKSSIERNIEVEKPEIVEAVNSEKGS
jgi:hypothetical protein